jgi:hypothetical protein
MEGQELELSSIDRTIGVGARRPALDLEDADRLG